jgi:cytochrome P450
MSASEETVLRVESSEAGGCPVVHGLNFLGPVEVNEPSGYTEFLRREAPVSFVPETGFYLATRHEDVSKVLTDHQAFEALLPPTQVPEEARDLLPNGFVYQQEGAISATAPPDHTRLRKLAQRGFTRGAVASWAAPIEAMCNDLVDEFAGAGQAELVGAYTSRFPIQVIATILRIDREETAQLYEWALDIFRLFGDPSIPHDEMMAICRRQVEFQDWALALIEERRALPEADEGDVIRSFIDARDEDGGARLSDTEIFSLVVAMIAGGADTSSAAAAQMLRRILLDDDLRSRVEQDYEFLYTLMEEELRHDFVGRMAFRRVVPAGAELNGVELPGGALVGAHIWSANHDEAAFGCPAQFDPDREDANKLLSWGKATHFCLGAPLARLEVTTAVRVALQRLPNLRLVPGHELQRVPAFFLPNVIGGLEVAWDV